MTLRSDPTHGALPLESEDPARRGSVLVVDDDEGMRHFVSRALAKRGFEVTTASEGADGRRLLGERSFDVLVTDVRMPLLTGEELLQASRIESPGTRCILMTAYGSVRSAVDAVSKGAETYLEKPFETDELVAAVERAAESARLDRDNRVLRELLRSRDPYGGLVGVSRGMRRLFQQIDQLARNDLPVAIVGESGTGKEMVARALHERSSRKDGPFVVVACGALPGSLAMVELFGAERGAYTGADRSRRGYLERAEGGTVCLEGITELSLEAQVALRRYLESGEVLAVGGGRARKLQTRIVATTPEDLRVAVAGGRLRHELALRLNVQPLKVPPLRDRVEDIPLLLAHFVEMLGFSALVFPPHVVAHIQGLPLRGNVRELRNLVERLGVLGVSVNDVADLPPEWRESTADEGEPRPYRLALEEFERDYLERALGRAGGDVAAAARASGMSRASFLARTRSLRIETVPGGGG